MQKRLMTIGLCSAAIITSISILAEYANQPFFSPEQVGRAAQSWFVGVGLGFEKLFFENRTNTLLEAPLPPPQPDIFTLSNVTAANGLVSVDVGHQWRLAPYTRFNVFMEYDHFSSFSPTGTRAAFGYPSSSFFYSPSQYGYTLEHQALLFGAKVNFAEWHQLMPYFEGGMGVSRNAFSDFNNTLTASSGLSGPITPFPNHVNYALAFVLGTGVDVLLQNNWFLTFGYRFGDWGNVQSGNVTTIPSPPGGSLSPIRLSNALYSNQALMRLSYSFSG